MRFTPDAKVIFLDIDGVLNNMASMRLRPVGQVDAACVARLRRVVETTGSLIVLSSTWRIGGLMRTKEAVHRAGWGDTVFPLVSATPVFHGKTEGGVYIGRKRGDEVQAWLDEHPKVQRYVIVDDDADFLEHQMERFVQTQFDDGLTDAHAARMIEILEAA